MGQLCQSSAVSDTCRYCQARGHWKKECPVLKAKRSTGQVKPAALAAPAVTSESRKLGQVQACTELVAPRADYAAFMSEGWVSLVGGGGQVPIKILRDTGALDSFILESVLPFSFETDTGECVITLGMGMVPFSVPLHRLVLSCGLAQGEVSVGVRPQLPVKGVHMILGNDLAGDKVWAKGEPKVVKPPMSPTALVPSVTPLPSSNIFPGCAITRAASRDAQSVMEPECLELPETLRVEQLAGSQALLVAEQKADSSLTELFDRVVPASEVRNTAQCYFLQNGLLVRKWLSHDDASVGEPIFQVVVPTNCRSKVLQMSHGEMAGHLGIRKTYDRILQHFFWPRLKRDVALFIKSCHTCQLTGKPNQVVKPAPLQPIPSTGQPFEHLIIDCVGPLP